MELWKEKVFHGHFKIWMDPEVQFDLELMGDFLSVRG
jgi:hypothetical protein